MVAFRDGAAVDALCGIPGLLIMFIFHGFIFIFKFFKGSFSTDSYYKILKNPDI